MAWLNFRVVLPKHAPRHTLELPHAVQNDITRMLLEAILKLVKTQMQLRGVVVPRNMDHRQGVQLAEPCVQHAPLRLLQNAGHTSERLAMTSRFADPNASLGVQSMGLPYLMPCDFEGARMRPHVRVGRRMLHTICRRHDIAHIDRIADTEAHF